MNASVYGAESRAIPRWTVAALPSVAAVLAVALILARAPGPRTSATAPAWLRVPFEVPAVAALLALVAVAAFVCVGRRRASVRAGLVGLAALAYLVESQAVLTGSAEREMYICGALAAGWTFGQAFVRQADRALGRASDGARDDLFGEAGAAGALVAVYLCAATSKLLEASIGWIDGASLLVSVVQRRTFSSTPGVTDACVDVLLRHPELAGLGAVATVTLQTGMVLYLVSPRLRMVCATLLISLHLCLFLLMGVSYVSPVVALLAFSFPWPRILRPSRARGAAAEASTTQTVDAEVPVEALVPLTRRFVALLAATWALTVVAWLGIHRKDSSRLFHEIDHGAKDGPTQSGAGDHR